MTEGPTCTDCGGTGETYQTERRCACQRPIMTEARDLFDWLKSLPGYQSGTWLQEQTDATAAKAEAQERLIETLTAALEEIRDMPVMNAVTVYEIARAAIPHPLPRKED